MKTVLPGVGPLPRLAQSLKKIRFSSDGNPREADDPHDADNVTRRWR